MDPKKILIEFLSSSQTFRTTNEHTTEHFKELVVNSLNEYDQLNAFISGDTVMVTPEDDYTVCVVKMFFDSKNSYYFEKTSVISEGTQEQMQMTVFAAMCIMNSHTEWETEIIPYDDPSIEGESIELVEFIKSETGWTPIQLFLSTTPKVTLTNVETLVIENILKRLALAHGVKYSEIKDKSFEIELRGYVPAEDQTTDQDEDSEDMWI